jgi:preprotein translocase subunit SecG
MFNILLTVQVLSGLITAFFILIHEPKSEGLGSIGSSAGHFRGVRTSADEKLDTLTWFFAIIFLASSAVLGLFFGLKPAGLV